MSPAKNIFSMGPDLERLKNFNGIYISPESALKRPVVKKKPSTGGVDIRYKMRDLEFASAMTSDDFFFSGGTSSGPSKSNTS